jgi:hypothetical protein
MKAKRKWFLVVLGFVFTGYLMLIVWPHFAAVQVVNNAGITGADVRVIVRKLENDENFLCRRELGTVVSSFFEPASTPQFFVEITGTPEEIFITAGHGRGELLGGAWLFRARKVDGHWVFVDLGSFWRS